MKTKITVKKAADDISKEEPVLPPDDVNEGLLEFGELIDDICSDYVEEELFNSGDAIDNYDIFYNQNNEMFLNDNIVTDNANQGNPESLLEYFNVGEEVSVATNNPEEQLSTTEIDSINNLYEAICNENQQQAANIQELFNLPIDKPEQLNPQPEQLNPQPEQLNPQPEQLNPQPEQLNPQQDISYVNHIDTELGQNIWYDDNLENIVPNFECDMLSFSDSDLSDSDEQQGNGNKSAKSLKTLIDHAQYTITADLNDNSQTHLSLYDSLCDESFPTIENQLPSVQTSNCNSIFSDKTIVNSPSTFQNSINFSNSSDKYITHVNRRNRSKIKTSKFQNVMKIQNVYMKYCVVDSHSKLHVVNKADKMVNLMTKHLNKPQTSEADKTKRRRLLSKGTKGTLDKINNEKSNPMKMSKIQLFLEVKNVNRVRKFDFSDESFMLDFFSCLERSPRAYSELRKVNFVNNNEKIKYYTGIPGYQYFVALLNCLNLPSLHVASSFEMLLLTLVKMKLNLDWTDIAFRFGENVECIKNVFGYTVSIILECIPKLIQWLPEFTHVERGSLIYYIYKIDLMSKNPSDSLVERIYVCFSNSTHPVLFVSNPTTEVFSTSAELLEKSGIRQGVEHGDIIVFDNKVALHLNDILYSLDLSKQVTNTIPLDKRVFQCETYREGQFRLVRKSITTNKRLMNQLLNVQKRVSQMYSYNFLNDLNRCEYLNNSRNHELFYDVLRIVCGLMNLCNTLPFSLNNVKKLMDERKNLKMAPLF